MSILDGRGDNVVVLNQQGVQSIGVSNPLEGWLLLQLRGVQGHVRGHRDVTKVNIQGLVRNTA